MSASGQKEHSTYESRESRIDRDPTGSATGTRTTPTTNRRYLRSSFKIRAIVADGEQIVIHARDRLIAISRSRRAVGCSCTTDGSDF
jgi:hypothetical protein